MTEKKDKQKLTEKKTLDSDNELSESEEEMFTQGDFEDALKRVSRICEPDEES